MELHLPGSRSGFCLSWKGRKMGEEQKVTVGTAQPEEPKHEGAAPGGADKAESVAEEAKPEGTTEGKPESAAEAEPEAPSESKPQAAPEAAPGTTPAPEFQKAAGGTPEGAPKAEAEAAPEAKPEG